MKTNIIIKEYLTHFFTIKELAIYLNIDESVVEDTINRSEDRKVINHTHNINLWNRITEEDIVLRTPTDKTVIDVANYIIETKSSVRDTSKKFDKSKTTIHEYMTDRLPSISITLYKKVFDVMQNHKSLSLEYKETQTIAMKEYYLLKNGSTIKEISELLNQPRNKIQRDLAERFSVIDKDKAIDAKEALNSHQKRFNLK